MSEILQEINGLRTMKQVGPRPSLDALVDELLGRPHAADFNCWDLVRYLYERGRGVHLDAEADLNALVLHEVWFRDDARPVSEIVQPWDGLVMNVAGPLADHAGIVMDAEYFVHSRTKIGVCKEHIQKWHTRILQVVRVQARD